MVIAPMLAASSCLRSPSPAVATGPNQNERPRAGLWVNPIDHHVAGPAHGPCTEVRLAIHAPERTTTKITNDSQREDQDELNNSRPRPAAG